MFNGYLCFVISIAYIGVCTAVIGDVAAQLGCFIYLKDSVNAIAFVALGTSVPGIKASRPVVDRELPAKRDKIVST
jgi:solute carrier family 8 (sodium/calcium exchanger)